MELLKTNYHTHTIFCDGKNTAEEMVLSAIEKKTGILGFSAHSMFPYSSDWHLPSNDFEKYAEEIRRLKEKYADRIEICLGFEADYIAGVTAPDSRYDAFSPDFLIGSVHFVPGKKGYFVADDGFDDCVSGIKNAFGGDVKAAVCEYFACQREMLSKTNPAFLAHPDLIKKQNHGNFLFDENEGWYRKELESLAESIARNGVCVEVNTGGIARRGMKEPYPSPYLMELLCRKKVPVTINSDAHTSDGIDAWFSEGVGYVKNAGYSEIAYLHDKKLCFQKI